MRQTDDGPRVHRLRALAERLVGRIGGLPAVRTLRQTLETFYSAGGGLLAGGLAYAAMLAVMPALLLLLAVAGLLIDDPAVRADIVDAISEALPPLAPIAQVALDQVAAGAVPTSIVALVGLVWASSRFYSALDRAFMQIFRTERRRNMIERDARGVLVVMVLIALPLVMLGAGSVVSWLLDLAPARFAPGGGTRLTWQLGTPLLSVLAFVGGTALVYRLVPTITPRLAALGPPAIVVGVALGAFTQLFTFIAPRMIGLAALYGTLVVAFALLAWLSISFQVLLIGGAWTYVRSNAAAPEREAT